jgi:hypothetical protein
MYFNGHKRLPRHFRKQMIRKEISALPQSIHKHRFVLFLGMTISLPFVYFLTS